MSGRTFTYQGNFDDFVRFLLPDVEMSSRRKSVGIGDSMLREIEEFMNRFVVTAVNDAGDIIFDAAGSYTFQGDVIIGGELQSSNWVNDTAGWQLRSDGTFEFNSSGDVRGDLGVHGNMTMFTGGAMKTNASGQRAEMSEATTSTSIVGGAANFSGIDLYSGDAAEVEPGLLGISNTTSGSSTVVLAAADLYGSGQRPYLYLGSNTAGTLDTRLNDPSRVYLTAGNTSVDINQTGIDIRVADGSFELGVKNLPSGSYHDKIFLTEDLVTFTLNNAEQMRLNTTGLGIGTNNPTQALDVAGTATATALAVTGEFTLPTSDGSANQVLVTNGSGTVSWATQSTSSPGGSDGQVQYNNGGSFGGASDLHYDDSNNRVGIGTTSPAAKLDVAGDTTSTGHFTAQSGGADGGIVLGQAFSSSYVGLRTANMSESSGNEYNLITDGNHTFISAGSTGDVYIRGGGNSTGAQIQLDTDASYVNITGNVALEGGLQITASGGDINFFNNALVASYASSSNIDHIWHNDSTNEWHFCSDTTYKATGNSALRAGASTFRANGGAILTLQDTGSTDTGGYISFTQSGGTRMGFVGYANNDDLYMKNDNSGGNLYFGVQAGYALQVSTGRHLLPYSDNTHNLGGSGRAWNHFYLHQANTFSSGGYWTLRSRDSDRQVMELVSSERFKKDIVDMPLEEAYEVLDARVIKYRGIDDDDDAPLEAGLSAESLHDAGYEYAVRYDEGHWGETPRSIYYEYLTVPLIKICQDQRDRIESLETRLAALEA